MCLVKMTRNTAVFWDNSWLYWAWTILWDGNSSTITPWPCLHQKCFDWLQRPGPHLISRVDFTYSSSIFPAQTLESKRGGLSAVWGTLCHTGVHLTGAAVIWGSLRVSPAVCWHSGFRFQGVFQGAGLSQTGLLYVKIHPVEFVISWKFM